MTHLKRFFEGRRLLFALWLVATLAVLVVTARLSVFMFDPTATSYSMLPEEPFMRRHSCFSAYVAAAELSEKPGINVYDPSLYPREGDDALRPIPLGDFEQDKYEYAPVFLLVPRLLVAVSRDFATLRGIWFVLEMTVLLGALGLIARWIGDRRGTATALLIPLSWGAFSSLLAIQTGNVQLVVYALTILAMIAFERGRPAVGGAMLAFATGTKLYPGIFFLVLLAQRRWKAALWTAGFGLFYCASTVAVFGVEPFRDFLFFQLPRLMSGEAFDFFKENIAGKAANFSLYGLPYRLEVLGLLDEPDRIASALGRLYTPLIAGVALFVGWKTRDFASTEDAAARSGRVILWMALLDLAILRAPFLPPYGLVGTVWMLSVWAPGARTFTRAALLFLPAYLLLTLLPPSENRAALVAGLGAALLNIGLNVFALRAALLGKRSRDDPTTTREPSSLIRVA